MIFYDKTINYYSWNWFIIAYEMEICYSLRKGCLRELCWVSQRKRKHLRSLRLSFPQSHSSKQLTFPEKHLQLLHRINIDSYLFLVRRTERVSVWTRLFGSSSILYVSLYHDYRLGSKAPWTNARLRSWHRLQHEDYNGFTSKHPTHVKNNTMCLHEKAIIFGLDQTRDLNVKVFEAYVKMYFHHTTVQQ